MSPLTLEEMKMKVCPMTIMLATPKKCIGGSCMMWSKLYKVESVHRDGDLDFQSKFKGFYCSLGNKRNKR